MTDGVVPSHVAAACTLVILDGLREHGRRLQSEKGTIVLPMDARQLIYKAVPTKKQLEKMLEADFKHVRAPFSHIRFTYHNNHASLFIANNNRYAAKRNETGPIRYFCFKPQRRLART
jgi:hypothetical protein